MNTNTPFIGSNAGGTGGIGSATAQVFVSEGAVVFITDLEERGIVDRLGGPSKASFMRCDVSSASECEAAVAACVDKHGRLDVLFHNAGILQPLGGVVDTEIAVFENVVRTNLFSLFYLARAAIPHLRRRRVDSSGGGGGGGAIVTTSSTAGCRADYALPAYGTAKAGLINLTRVMALDHARDGVRVNCVCPGYTRTPLTQSIDDAGPAVLDVILDAVPMKRAGMPEEIAKVVAFLASDDASYITGQGTCCPSIIVPLEILSPGAYVCFW